MRKITTIFLKAIGLVLILIGLVAAYYGPLEIFVFYLFSEGGQFYYHGFGMGSLWFAALVVQNIGYYLIAALFLPVGIGHMRKRRWALTLTQLYLWFWLGFGILLFGNFILLIPSINLPYHPTSGILRRFQAFSTPLPFSRWTASPSLPQPGNANHWALLEVNRLSSTPTRVTTRILVW